MMDDIKKISFEKSKNFISIEKIEKHLPTPKIEIKKGIGLLFSYLVFSVVVFEFSELLTTSAKSVGIDTYIFRYIFNIYLLLLGLLTVSSLIILRKRVMSLCRFHVLMGVVFTISMWTIVILWNFSYFLSETSYIVKIFVIFQTVLGIIIYIIISRALIRYSIRDFINISKTQGFIGDGFGKLGVLLVIIFPLSQLFKVLFKNSNIEFTSIITSVFGPFVLFIFIASYWYLSSASFLEGYLINKYKKDFEKEYDIKI